ncbi:tannase and feruloyl esterase [Hypoxylon rubiginosum]|uniref:Tannase and feruloyl esterase n=1 Tax=Hypoxylon rubiginosum TaxID=110542 RepID=A0ACC0CZ61_9PEZI|nr:tannase and feruloyl esterase [Hypoxylon rubiginosum]
MCSPSTIPYPELPGARFTSLTASLVSNLTVQIPRGGYTNHGAVSAEGVSYCHVTTTYAHTGQDETITVDVYLPTSGWNGRMQGVGGGGWIAGGANARVTGPSMLGAVANGYAAVTTDAGHASPDPYDWVLKSPGVVNQHLLDDFATSSLNEVSIIGKAIVESHYGTPPTYSYWNGCSQGGRQGLKLASSYPNAFDGIAASAPVVDLIGVGMGNLWPYVFMNALGHYSKNCELAAIGEAAIDQCDGDDGLLDGIISYPDGCKFDPYSVVGQAISCNDTGIPEIVHISETAAKIANATWTGPRSIDDSIPWWGLKKGARLVEENLGFMTIPGLATTVCSTNGTCVGKPNGVAEQWAKLLVKKDPAFDVSTVTIEEFQEMYEISTQEYGPAFETEPNLDAFRDAGGKMISFHGLADTVVPPDSTRHFFDRVAAKDKQVHDYYRLFEAAGLGHCSFGLGGYYPEGIFDALVSWVESDIIPGRLVAHTGPMNGTERSSILCPYPQKPYYNALGSYARLDDFLCEDWPPWMDELGNLALPSFG